MIPRVIHYCWFGGKNKPDSVINCIHSWKKYCPGYNIVEWNERNFDVSISDYVKEAYESENWAFVSDFARLWIVFHDGGIYLDTDVEVVRSFDELLDAPAFFGFEDCGLINTGLGFGAEKGNPAVGKMLREYDGIHFILPDGSCDKTPCPVRNTRALEQLLGKESDRSSVIKTEEAILYPPEYFCPLSADGKIMRKTANTMSIHWFDASWLSSDEKIVHDFRVFRGKCERLFGRRLGSVFARMVYLFLPKKRNVLKRM